MQSTLCAEESIDILVTKPHARRRSLRIRGELLLDVLQGPIPLQDKAGACVDFPQTGQP